MKKLSICIPTYNRSDLLISQLEFLRVEILPFVAEIEIIVADNCSSVEHRNKIIDYHNHHTNNFELKLNQVNLGSIGNIYYLLENVNSEYVWFLSDDDVLVPGILKRLIEILTVNQPLSYVFLNFTTFVNNPDICKDIVDLDHYFGYFSEGKECLIDLFKRNGPISMFITSCVYNVKSLQLFASERKTQTLMDPLLFSFVLAQGSIYIEKEIFIKERCENFSWSNEGHSIFGWQIQVGLIELLSYSYTRKDISQMIYTSYLKGKYFRMLLYSPYTSKLEIVKILGFKQVYLVLIQMRMFFFKLLNAISNK
jgi:glycosyltransferase involved in cell wall biosynthesis